ncbi:hypothetical protein PTTG_09964 [Puccinia triticina 1-1 BBBD Race 1]|uniref:Uncharacterized protein n=1 Tax=Puccinia triticina (isolate 1-1 / race 1 (BBBD)) TaxID=630390 RepID=A0A180G6I4_PUCT1|nr:hypothetical protein PTTG_09964 [Puccinia triticina 1-1 BBBD Race 1]
MSLNRTPNHPANMTGLFEPLGESVPEAVRANQFGNVTTPSFVQCGGLLNNKTEEFEIKVTTNTALNNILDSSFIHHLSGKFMPLNDGSTPKLTYVHEMAAPVVPILDNVVNFTNRAVINSLGLVTARQEVVSEAGDGTSNLEVIIAHNDWDPQERAHKRFSIKYIVPGSKLYIETFNLYVVGRKLKLTGRLVDFEMENNMAVVIPCGHNLRSHDRYERTDACRGGIRLKPHPKRTHSLSTPIFILNFTSLTSHHIRTKVSATKATPVASGSLPPVKKTADTPTRSPKSKGKAKQPSPKASDGGETASEEEFDDESEEEIKPKARGRPCKNILKDAAKRMKQS